MLRLCCNPVRNLLYRSDTYAFFGGPCKDTSDDTGQKPSHKRKRESGGSSDNGWNGYTDPNDLPTDGCGNSQW